jgi:hypothetical protein
VAIAVQFLKTPIMKKIINPVEVAANCLEDDCTYPNNAQLPLMKSWYRKD